MLSRIIKLTIFITIMSHNMSHDGKHLKATSHVRVWKIRLKERVATRDSWHSIRKT